MADGRSVRYGIMPSSASAADGSIVSVGVAVLVGVGDAVVTVFVTLAILDGLGVKAIRDGPAVLVNATGDMESNDEGKSDEIDGMLRLDVETSELRVVGVSELTVKSDGLDVGNSDGDAYSVGCEDISIVGNDVVAEVDGADDKMGTSSSAKSLSSSSLELFVLFNLSQ